MKRLVIPHVFCRQFPGGRVLFDKVPVDKIPGDRAVLIISTLSCFLVGMMVRQPTHAMPPEQINIDEILGNSSELFIRRSGRKESIQIGSRLQRMRDDLITSPPNNARALLRFLSAGGGDLNFFVQTNTHPEPAIYYFPCQVNGGNNYIGWGLARNESRGCENGMYVTHRPHIHAQGTTESIASRVQRSDLVQGFQLDQDFQRTQSVQRTDALDSLSWSFFKPLSFTQLGLDRLSKWLAQGGPRPVFYCNTVGLDGATGFVAGPLGNPCPNALEQCQLMSQLGSSQVTDEISCEIMTMGSWWTHEDAIHASLRCLALPADGEGVLSDLTASSYISLGQWIDPEVFFVEGPGDAIASTLDAIFAERSGQGCLVHIHRPQDFVLVPAADEQVLALGDDSILVQTRNTPDGLEVDVLEGAVNVYASNRSEPQLVSQGQRYIHPTSGDRTVTAFDREIALKSVDMEVLCTFASDQMKNLDVPVCVEADLYIPTTNGQLPLVFCNREQGSGGQKGDQRTLQMGTNQGDIIFEYEAFDARDRFQLIYEGREILDTGFVSGDAHLTIPFSGRSGRVDVIVTGNPAISTTEWNYTLQCP